MPVCNNTTSVRTQELRITETLVFWSSPVQISTVTIVTNIFTAVLSPSTKCVTTSKRITVTSLYPTILFRDHPTISHYTKGSS